MRDAGRSLVLTGLVVLAGAADARAGMPMITLTDVARLRFQAISFFLAGFLLSAWAVQRIWNSLRGDFPRLPRLGFGRALGLVSLWGLLFLLVLTMISGARELMTPGAWTKNGLTSTLADAPPAPPSEADTRDRDRREGLDRLRVALWTYARGHGGHFPPADDVPEIPVEVWIVPDPSRMRYVYHGAPAAGDEAAPLASEPDIFGEERLVLLSDGRVRRMSTGEIERLLGAEER